MIINIKKLKLLQIILLAGDIINLLMHLTHKKVIELI